MTPEAKRFILFHEEGHLVLQTKNELEADRYAFEKYVGEGHSLKAGVKALTRVLSDSPNHLIRSKAILHHAKNHQDMSDYTGQLWFTEAWENFIGKKAKERREAKREMKAERKEAKHDAKLTRISNRAQRKVDRNDRRNLRVESKAIQRETLAEFGVTPGGEALKGISGTVGAISKGFATVATGGLSDLVNPGVPPAAPQVNFPIPSPAEQQFATSSGFSPVQETLSSTEPEFESPMGLFTNNSSARQNKNLPWIIGGVIAAVLVIVLIMRK